MGWQSHQGHRHRGACIKADKAPTHNSPAARLAQLSVVSLFARQGACHSRLLGIQLLEKLTQILQLSHDCLCNSGTICPVQYFTLQEGTSKIKAMMKAAQLHRPPACTNVQHQCETCTTGQHLAACNGRHSMLKCMLSHSAYTCFVVHV